MGKKFDFDEGRRHALVKIDGVEYRVTSPPSEISAEYEEKHNAIGDKSGKEIYELTYWLFDKCGLPTDAAKKIPVDGLFEILEEIGPKKN